jgi:hypothetical protein
MLSLFFADEFAVGSVTVSGFSKRDKLHNEIL